MDSCRSFIRPISKELVLEVNSNMDLFTKKDIQLNKQEHFWRLEGKTTAPLQEPYLCTGKLLQKSGEQVWGYYKLTSNYLVQCKDPTGRALRRSNINWKYLEVVNETSSQSKGFKLSTQTCSETFYTESLTELQVWVEHLTRLCVLTTLADDYDLLEELGRGSYSVVRKAQDRRTQEMTAIKLVNKNSVGGDNSLKEVDLMRRLTHCSVLKVLSVYDADDHVAIVLEYCAGGTLLDYIVRHKRIDESKAREFAVQLLTGIAYCHSKQCVHRDLKLENILLVRPGDVLDFKIADFGLAADLEIEKLGRRCGSKGYLAPEIILSRPQTAKIDVFSAGVILYMCLSGTAPFGGKDEASALKSNSVCCINLDTVYWAHISEQAKSLVRCMTFKEPMQRMTSAEALTHSWLSTLHSITEMSPQAELEDSPLTRSPKVSYDVSNRVEETKCSYLNSLVGRRTAPNHSSSTLTTLRAAAKRRQVTQLVASVSSADVRTQTPLNFEVGVDAKVAVSTIKFKESLVKLPSKPSLT
jgi:serine/threonine protein kinase